MPLGIVASRYRALASTSIHVVNDAGPCQGVVERVALQFHVLVDEGEGPLQAASVHVAQVLAGVAAAVAPASQYRGFTINSVVASERCGL